METERSWVQIPQGAEGNGGGSFEAGVGVGVGVAVGVGDSHEIFGVGTLKESEKTNYQKFVIASYDETFE